LRLVGRSEAVSGVDFPLDQGALTVGSAASNTIQVDHPAVAPHHLRLHRSGAQWMLEPLDAAYPVYLNGIRVIGRHAVRPGDQLAFGPVSLAVLPDASRRPRRPHPTDINRRAWLVASMGSLLALLAFVVSLQAGLVPLQPLKAVEQALVPTNTPARPTATASPTSVPATAVTATGPSGPAPAASSTRRPTIAATPTREFLRATLEAALAAAPLERAVAAMTAVAMMPPGAQQQALAELRAAPSLDDWLNELLGTPTPVPPQGRIAFGRYGVDTGRYDIILRDLATGEEIFLLAQASQPAFSPDGRTVAYHSWQPNALGLFAATADGTQRWLLTRDAHPEDGYPAWSPDGSVLAFASLRLGDGMSRIYTVPAHGGNATSIAYGEYADYAPEGDVIAIKSCVGGSCGIMLVRPDGTGQEFLTTDATDGAPAWSPDGQRIAFHSYRDDNWSIFVMNRDGTGFIQLTDAGGTDCVPTWSPDGRYLAFRSNRGGEWAIWVVPANGGPIQRLFTAPIEPGDELVERLSWLP
jgi:hypothetical protein